MKKTGFTIIELLIVITIIGILIGVAVPYYNDYIYDARLSVLKQNLAAWRSSINQFRGDNQRGPFAVTVANAGPVIHQSAQSAAADGSELVSGPIQIISGVVTRRANIKYLPSLPILQDPNTGADIPPGTWTIASPTAFFYDADNDSIFDIDTEWAFIDGNGNNVYLNNDDAKFDTGILLVPPPTVLPPVGGTFRGLDYTTISVTGADGTKY